MALDNVLHELTVFTDRINIPAFQFANTFNEQIGNILPTLNITADNFQSSISKINSDMADYKDNLKIGHLNTSSIPKHREEIYRTLRMIDLDIFAASETNIKPGTPSKLFNFPDYKLIRADRTHRTKGGVLKE